MESKPIITYAVDKSFTFSSLEFGISQGLPLESIEWRRSFGRAPKKVYVECKFVEFSEDLLHKDGNWKLIGQALLHTYWTDCMDVDQYKATVRDGIAHWMTVLKNHGIHDWLIVSVETMDSRKVTKTKLLPRASVTDKIRSDFCGSSPDHCVCLLDPQKSDARGAESWQGLLQRIRQLVLQAYNRYLNKFEEHMRSQREKRNELGWSFCEYFLLQEELAFVFEMLGIYDESLVQYDELDALFTQFVLNSNVGDTPDWLNRFSRTCNTWKGLTLVRTVDQHLRELIGAGKASLLELRNYLFSRQCALLLLQCRPWEVAQRTLPILHNCINELQILEVNMPPGAVSCWVFLCSLEVLYNCERFNDSGQVEAYSLYTAGLWAYARDKLQELGVLCGLMPGMAPTSEQLHTVVMLISGMEDGTDGPDRSPVAKLKEALSSKESFQCHYLELSELAMGTFKHIGRIRSARLIGKDLADFYMMLNEPQKAAAFLSDMQKTSLREGWSVLAVDTQQALVRCYRAMNDYEKFDTGFEPVTIGFLGYATNGQQKRAFMMSSGGPKLHGIKQTYLPEPQPDYLAASSCLDELVRAQHFEQMLTLRQKIGKEAPVIMPAREVLRLGSVSLVADSSVIICDSNITVTVEVESLLVERLPCDAVCLSVQHVEVDPTAGGQDGPRGAGGVRNDGVYSREWSLAVPTATSPFVVLVEHLERKQDGTLTASSLVCLNAQGFLCRRDSQYDFHPDRGLAKKESSFSVAVENVVLAPGKNMLKFSCKAGPPGCYILSQLLFKAKGLEFLFASLEPVISYTTVCETPTVFLQRASKGDLIAGAEQELLLTVHSGSTVIEPDTVIRLQASKDLLLKVEDSGDEEPAFMQSVECVVPTVGPFQTAVCKVKVMASVLSLKDGGSFERNVNIISPWSMEKLVAYLVFVLPFATQHRLHTTGSRKFIQVIVQGLQADEFELCDHTLTAVNCGDVSVTPLNPSDQHLVVCKEQNACYVWEVVSNILETPPLQFEFTMKYKHKTSDGTTPQATYKHQFEFGNYKTLYTIRSKIEPIGSEFCRLGSICHMNVTILCDVIADSAPSLMYEVLADQMFWAVCGRTAGVVTAVSDGQCSITLDVMPLTRGFLPIPNVRLSKYIPADSKLTVKDSPKKVDIVASCTAPQYPRLEPFAQGQVFNVTKAVQVHVLPALGANSATEAVVT